MCSFSPTKKNPFYTFVISFTVKGYERSKINLQSIKRPDDGQLSSLMSMKKNLLLELSQYAANAKINKDNFEAEDTKFIPDDRVAVIPSNTRLQIAIATNTSDPNNVSGMTNLSFGILFAIESFKQMHIELSVSTNNETIIKALIIFSEGIFEGEALIGYSSAKPTSRIILPFQTPKTMAYDIHLKVFALGSFSIASKFKEILSSKCPV